MKHFDVTLAAPDLEAAVHGLTATTDEGAALLAQLEALLSGAAPVPAYADGRAALTREVVADALRLSGGSISRAAVQLGRARSTVREAARRFEVRA